MSVATKLKRCDFLTSAAIDHALRMQLQFGTDTARRYMARTCIPFDMADRVLMTTSRRPPLKG